MPKPVVLPRAKHCISRANIDPDALKVIRRLQQHGFTAFLVGGGVRDLLLGLHPKDFDVGTDAHPNQIKKLFRNCFLIGRRFRLAHIRFGRDKIIETSTFRREPASGSETAQQEAPHARDNTFGTPEEDALRRDFTVNGLFYNLRDFSVIDHVGGLKDLKRGLLRCIGNPDVRLSEDPVRMVRAVRFASRLGFRIEPRTARAMRRHHAEIATANPARMIEEIHKLFGFRSAEAAFRLLYDTGLMKSLLPEISAHLDPSRDRRNDPLWRCLAALDSGTCWPTDTPPTALLWAALIVAPVERAYAERVKRQAGNAVPWPQFVNEWTSPLAQRFRMPRQLQHHLLLALDDQEHMTRIDPSAGNGRHRSPRRLRHHATFPLSLALLKIRSAAGLVSSDVAQQWNSIVNRERPGDDESIPKSSRRRRRRRRRRKTEPGQSA